MRWLPSLLANIVVGLVVYAFLRWPIGAPAWAAAGFALTVYLGLTSADRVIAAGEARAPTSGDDGA